MFAIDLLLLLIKLFCVKDLLEIKESYSICNLMLSILWRIKRNHEVPAFAIVIFYDFVFKEIANTLLDPFS